MATIGRKFGKPMHVASVWTRQSTLTAPTASALLCPRIATGGPDCSFGLRYREVFNWTATANYSSGSLRSRYQGRDQPYADPAGTRETLESGFSRRKTKHQKVRRTGPTAHQHWEDQLQENPLLLGEETGAEDNKEIFEALTKKEEAQQTLVKEYEQQLENIKKGGEGADVTKKMKSVERMVSDAKKDLASLTSDVGRARARKEKSEQAQKAIEEKKKEQKEREAAREAEAQRIRKEKEQEEIRDAVTAVKGQLEDITR